MRMGGIAKGSGMIHPNMATMLSVITTDARVAPDVWQGIMKRGAENSFNQVILPLSLQEIPYYSSIDIVVVYWLCFITPNAQPNV